MSNVSTAVRPKYLSHFRSSGRSSGHNLSSILVSDHVRSLRSQTITKSLPGHGFRSTCHQNSFRSHPVTVSGHNPLPNHFRSHPVMISGHKLSPSQFPVTSGYGFRSQPVAKSVSGHIRSRFPVTNYHQVTVSGPNLSPKQFPITSGHVFRSQPVTKSFPVTNCRQVSFRSQTVAKSVPGHIRSRSRY